MSILLSISQSSLFSLILSLVSLSLSIIANEEEQHFFITAMKLCSTLPCVISHPWLINLCCLFEKLLNHPNIILRCYENIMRYLEWLGLNKTSVEGKIYLINNYKSMTIIISLLQYFLTFSSFAVLGSDDELLYF